jgi:hypothetical protein
VNRISIDVDKKAIEELMSDLESGQYALPSFQRQYVWDEDDVKDLVDSIVNGYPIGTVILWKPSTTTVFEKDPFRKPLLDVDEAKSGEMFYVIDGQQRLTSFLLLFRDWRITRGGKEIKLEIPISYNPTTKRFLKSKTRGIDLSRLIKAFWLRDTDTLSKLIEDTPKDIFEEMKEKVDRVLRYKVPVYVMKTYQEDEETFLDMAEAFIRVNRYGVRIGNLELMLSFLAGAISGDLKEKVYELYESSYGVFETELQPIIRFAFSNFGLKQTQISRVNQFKANVRRISNFTNAQTSTIFEKCKTAMNATVGLLKEELGISNSRLLPSQVPLVTVASYLYQKNADKLHDLEQEDREKILDWFMKTSRWIPPSLLGGGSGLAEGESLVALSSKVL